MDYIAPTDAELAATTEEDLLGIGTEPDHPLAGLPGEHPAARYPVLLGTHASEEADAMGAIFDGESYEPMRECWIDLERRCLHHVLGCTCIIPAETASDYANSA